MGIDAAFLGPQADEIFHSVAAFADARALDALDVPGEQDAARKAVEAAIGSALRRTKNPGARIALIKGDAGSGKTHVLTTTLKRGASMPTSEVYPAVLQLTAPVQTENYESWLLDATIRELSARYFGGDGNQSPLRRLAGRLLERVPVTDQDEYLRLVEDLEDDGEIPLALKFGRRLHKEAGTLLEELPPAAGFIACVLLAGFGDSSALNYLRSGVIDGRIESLGLEKVARPDERISVLRSLGLTAQIVGACLALAFDQVENTVRLGDEGLFVHTLTQAVRIAETVHNAAIIVVVLGVEYEDVVAGNRGVAGLPPSDRDRIERERPHPVHLGGGSPAFFRKVLARRIALLRQRAKLPAVPDSLAPLPEWFLPRIDRARSVRTALGEVARLRERAIELGRIPSIDEFPDVEPDQSTGGGERDLDKEWADFLDSAPLTRSRPPEATRAELLAWWIAEASRESVATSPATVGRTVLQEPIRTPVLDIRIESADGTVVHRRLAVCEAANRNHQLASQIEQFLAGCDGAVPAVLRTNGFPKGRQSQVAGALRKLEARSGLKLDIGDTEWHVLLRARDFAERLGEPVGFLAWRRDRQWLSQLVPPLQVLIAPPPTKGRLPGENEGNGGGAGNEDGSVPADPFPVHVGASFDGPAVLWDPYREPPDNLNNFSVLITGDAGSGKTQTIRVLIDAACREGLAAMLFDFKADYCDAGFAAPLGIEVIDVRTQGLPFNPLQPPPGGASGAQPIEHAHGISGVLARVFSLGPVQEGALREAIAQAYQDSGINPRDWMDPAAVEWPSFDLVLEHLRGQRQNAALVTKLAQLCDLGLFRPGTTQSFGSLMDTRVCLKLSDLPTDELKSAIAEIIIIQLHGHALRGDQPRRLKRLMVFDEAHRVKDSQRLEALAREGRAFGVGIVVGTQFPGDIPEAMAGNLATQLFLMNNQVSHRRFVASQLLGSAAGEKGHAMLDKLGRLRPLQGVYANAHYAGGVFVNVLPHHQRT